MRLQLRNRNKEDDEIEDNVERRARVGLSVHIDTLSSLLIVPALPGVFERQAVGEQSDDKGDAEERHDAHEDEDVLSELAIGENSKVQKKNRNFGDGRLDDVRELSDVEEL